MDKLFFVEQPRSFLRTALFAVFLELTFVSECVTSQEICIPGSRRNISYFNIESRQVDWNAAWQKCISRKSILPVICNKDEQDALTNHLNSTIGRSSAWTSGKKINFINWTWLDGKTLSGSISSEHSSYTHVTFGQRQSYKAVNPHHKSYYLCQYSGFSCNSENATNMTESCVIPSDDDQAWFNARNLCLKNGSDLAVLTDGDLDILNRSKKLDAGRSYWIGLRNNAWNWMWQETAKSGEEITYVDNWPNHSSSPDDECITVDSSNAEWKAVRCTDRYKVVCEINASESATQNELDSNVNSQVLLYSGVGAGIVIGLIVICSIVIILAVRCTKKSAENTPEQDIRDGSPNKPSSSSSSVDFLPVNAPVTKADDMRGVYAEIPLATLNRNNPDETETEQQPGIVYASLEFQDKTHLLGAR